MLRPIWFVLCSVTTVLATARVAGAQTPAPAGPPATQSVSAGLAVTQGNKDTSSVNLGYELVYDPKTKNIVKSDGLFLYGKTDGDTTADRLGLNARDEYQLTTRSYAYGSVPYLRDKFKNIEYLLAPTGGIGYRLVNSATTKFSVDGGAGGVWEKNPGFDVSSSGALTFGDKLTHQVTATTTLSQAFIALYKTKDFDDALYTLGAAVATSISAHSQLKVEVLDTYKNLVPAGIDKNDVALIVGLVFKR